MSATQSQAKKSSQQSTKKQEGLDLEAGVVEIDQTEEEVFIEAVLLRLGKLEDQNLILAQALSKFATLSGHGNYLKEFGLERWTPSKKDMGKY